MASEVVYDADAALTAELLDGMAIEARIGMVVPQFFRQAFIGPNTLGNKLVKSPTVSDAGSLTDGTALSNTAVNPTSVTLTATSGVGLKSVITGFSKLGSLLTFAEAAAAFLRATVNKIDVDACALLDNLDGAAGTSAADLTVGALLNAVYDLNEAAELGSRVMVLDPLQHLDVANDIVSSSAPVWSNPDILVPDFLNANMNTAYQGKFMGIPVYIDPNVVDDGTNKIGALFVANRALRIAWKWFPVAERVSAPEYGYLGETFAVSAAYAVGEDFGAAGSALTSGNT